MKQVYLDYCATAPVREQVIETMLPYFSNIFANASSLHTLGQKARKAVEDARISIANVIGADPEEVYFTSGGTEDDNLAIKGIAYTYLEKGKHIITSSIEHPAVLNCCRYLEDEGYEVTYVPVGRHGLISPESIRDALTPQTILVSIMLANNEVGTIQPIKEIGKITKERGIPLHTDAVQAVGKIPIKIDKLNVDLLSISGHKIYGPKGVGALYIRKGLPITPLMHGGHHEMDFRAGTENVAGIVGLAKAFELANKEREDFTHRMKYLRDILENGIKEKIEDVYLNGHPEKRLPNILNISFRGVEGKSLLFALDAKGIAVSTGSACSSGTLDPSHVLVAMGVPYELAQGSIRFSFGHLNNEHDVRYVLEVLSEVVKQLRKMSPLYKIKETI